MKPKSYFLIRHKDNIVKGPMPYQHMLGTLKAGEISSGAEISGDLGPWVFLDRHNELKLHYPKIYTFMHEQGLLPARSQWLQKLKKIF